MNSVAKSPIVEVIAGWSAAGCFGGAIAFAGVMLTPLGALPAAVAGCVAGAAALSLLARVDRPRAGLASFVPVDFDGAADVDERILSADEGDEELLLDDPLPAEDSRVVRLFTAGPGDGGAQANIPAPGEMLARIDNFLGRGRDSVSVIDPAAAGAAASAEASAALHAALADIRRSLRQA